MRSGVGGSSARSFWHRVLLGVTAVSMILGGPPGQASGSAPGQLIGTWLGEGQAGSVEVRFEADGGCQVDGKRGTYSFVGISLVLGFDGRTELYQHELNADHLRLMGALFPDGVELDRSVEGRAVATRTPVPDASVHSPDEPRVLSPDGRCSFIVPAGLEAEWFDRAGHGEMLFRRSGETAPAIFVRVGRLDSIQRGMEMQRLLKSLVEGYAGLYPGIGPSAAPQQGKLWRWPARSVEVRASAGGTQLGGWTALGLARPWYVHLLALGPKAEAKGLVALARKVFHDLRIRPGDRSRERELSLLGLWIVEGTEPASEKFWFGQSGSFRWSRPQGEVEGRFQVRGATLLLHWAGVEKELALRVPTGEGPGRRIELSGRRLLRLGPGDGASFEP